VGGAVLAVLLVASGEMALQSAADRTRSEALQTPSTLEVACGLDGVVVGTREVAAGPAGVTLRVSSTLPAGTPLLVQAPGYTGGGMLPWVTEEWVLPLPPGDVELTCRPSGPPRPGMSTRVSVADPDGHWREATLGDSGCTMTGGKPAWAVGPARGATARSAVSTLLVAMTAESGRIYTVKDAGLGYPAAATQTWVALAPDGRGFTIQVTAEPGRFSAGPEWLCGGEGMPPL
jgi:hypothetical protein